MPYISNSPALIPYLIQYQAQNYLTVSLLTVVVYDYILNLDQEQYKKSVLTYCYIFLRYIGLLPPVIVIVSDFPVNLSDKLYVKTPLISIQISRVEGTILDVLNNNALPGVLLILIQGGTNNFGRNVVKTAKS
ncbi:hypothetical protein CONPUDRAFT_75561 [Coniophora puteana RWD-64-598 SS2]|uniref:DUF6533 domain-containing protein n=1 Tax=Coniophora puteana (strain RWD-64-598) TaxID=741705 RepID=A0A5M3MFR7_CONPW|nr:uncharacterized protein CONPUDRAFT_75561 [Coniophora puteana RWD-64-598 SS2]EIW77760.1 hypothetical protein CONPUDRAFT_75561 [Coniophora puteana RWD-64-598 SS2]